MQVVESSAKDLAFTLLRSELHSGSAGAVVLNAADCLTQLASDMSNTDMPDAPPVLPTTFSSGGFRPRAHYRRASTVSLVAA